VIDGERASTRSSKRPQGAGAPIRVAGFVLFVLGEGVERRHPISPPRLAPAQELSAFDSARTHGTPRDDGINRNRIAPPRAVWCSLRAIRRTGSKAMARDACQPTSKYRRVLLKVSGEALMGERDYGLDPVMIQRIAGEIESVTSSASSCAW